MASIEKITSYEDLEQQLRAMCEGQLQAQQISQQGAIHCLTHLLQHGGTKEVAMEMLCSLRRCDEILRAEVQRRGLEPMFDRHQTRLN